MSSWVLGRYVTFVVLLGFVSTGLFVSSGSLNHPALASSDLAPTPRLLVGYGNLPLAFEASSGPGGDGVRFLSRAKGYTLSLSATDAVLAFTDKTTPGFLRTHLAGANPTPAVVGLDQLPGETNYLIGNDPASWKTDVPTYTRAKIQDVYPGVDLVYHGTQGQPEYDFVVAPGAHPDVIALEITGASGLTIDAEGDLVLPLPGGQVIQHRPVLFQDIAGVRRPVSGGYAILGPNRVGFVVGSYDPASTLVIDPSLTYSTYLGGSGYDQAYGIALGSDGSVYVTGSTTSPNFPTISPFQGTLAGSCSVFVSKINPSGSALVYSTYLGGSSCDYAYAIAVDSSGSAYVAGSASSSNFPIKNALQPTNRGGGDAFVTKLDPTGRTLVYSTYLGGSGYDYAQGIAVDSAGNAYVTGTTASVDFPTFQPFQSHNVASGGTAFVAKLNADGRSLAYGTYLGGSDYDQGQGIAVDGSGNAYITGTTGSANFPTVSAIQRTDPSPGLGTAFISKLNPAGSALVYSTYLGGSGVDVGNGIAVDSLGQAYATGFTTSSNFPTHNAFQSTKRGPENAYVTKLSASGTAYVYSTYLGGTGHDIGYAIAADSAGNAYLTGYTDSSNFPVVSPIQAKKVAFADVFISTLKADGSALTFSTYLGGSSYDDQGNGIAVDGAGNIFVTGYTQSRRFPLKNPLQATYGGGDYDVFVSKIGK